MIDVAHVFPDARPSGAGLVARCPGHDDSRASLSIGTGGDGRILLHCHAGCPLDTILAAVHLHRVDLFPAKVATTSPARAIVATYPYHDEGGQHLFDVVRFAPKAFRQRRADGAWTMVGVRRVLFGLPELVGQQTVYVTEGERDVLALRALGLVATTNPGGAGKWRDDYTHQLREAGAVQVVIVPDHDGPGRQHARTVATHCHAAGLTVTIVELPGVRPTGDVSDYLDAGHTRADLVALVQATAALTRADLDTRLDAAPIQSEVHTSRPSVGPSMRLLRLTPASAMTVRPVRWLWQDRLPLAALSLVAGREGIGKSIAVMTLAAEVTRGRLDGVYRGTPRSVMIAATEDSWEHTIVPRLMAAGASLDRVFRVDVITSDHVDTSLSLPRDLAELERVITAQQIALVILDPLMSRLDAALDTHKDSDVRQALEPVVTLADRTKTAVIALIHVNKSVSTDALTTLMGSRAFAAVARSVLFVMTDPDDDNARLLGLAKNNLGRTDLPTLRFHIVGCKVADTIDGAVWTGKLAWLGESDRSIRDALDVAIDSSGDRSATSEAGDWLSDFLSSRDTPVDSAVVKREGAKAGHSKDALQRAKKQTGVISVTSGFPRRAFWSLSGRVAQCAQSPGETATNALTAPAALTDTQSAHSTQWTQSGSGPRAAMPPGGDRERL